MLVSRVLRNFNQRTIRRFSSGHDEHHNPELWRKITFYICVPAIILAGINAYLLEEEEHKHPRPEFKKYEYLAIRNKPFPWGDGNHSLLHNPKYNALPTGYETEDAGHH